MFLGITLFTVHVRRGRPDVQDPSWNSHSKLNCITACIQASKAGVASRKKYKKNTIMQIIDGTYVLGGPS